MPSHENWISTEIKTRLKRGEDEKLEKSNAALTELEKALKNAQVSKAKIAAIRSSMENWLHEMHRLGRVHFEDTCYLKSELQRHRSSQ